MENYTQNLAPTAMPGYASSHWGMAVIFASRIDGWNMLKRVETTPNLLYGRDFEMSGTAPHLDCRRVLTGSLLILRHMQIHQVARVVKGIAVSDQYHHKLHHWWLQDRFWGFLHFAHHSNDSNIMRSLEVTMFFQMVLVLSVTPPYSIIQPASPRDMRRHTPKKTSQKQSSALSSELKQVKTSQTTRVANGVEKTKNMMQLEAPFHCIQLDICFWSVSTGCQRSIQSINAFKGYWFCICSVSIDESDNILYIDFSQCSMIVCKHHMMYRYM